MKTAAASLLLLLLAIAAPARGDDPKTGFNAFRMVKTRPIFDPDREPIRSQGPGPVRTPSPAAVRRTPDTLVLTGVMITPGKTVAFFTGSREEFRKILAVNGKIGDFMLRNVSPSEVELERDGKPFVVKVGQQLSMDGTTAAAPVTTTTASAPLPAAAPAASSSSPAEAAPAGSNDLLRRMMERRQKEISK